jgi:DNA-binding NarL/FixJ family response regulator
MESRQLSPPGLPSFSSTLARLTSTMTGRIRVLCVDDHPIVREGIALVVGRERDCDVLASASSGEQAVALFRRYHPDITLMDLRMPTMSGLDAIRHIRAEKDDAKIIVLTMYDGDEEVFRALEAGAATYLLKDTLSSDLVRVIRDVHAGRPCLPVDMQLRLQERLARRALSPREVQILTLLAHGRRNKEVADSLGISKDTVRVHVKQLMAKLKVKDRTAAISMAIRHGIIHVDNIP